MTKTFLTLLLSATVFSLRAQHTPFEFGVKGGLNLSSLSLGDDNIPSSRLKPGINIGLTGNYNFNSGFFLQTGLAFSTKGATIKGDAPLGFPVDAMVDGNTAPVLKSHQMYLQLPVDAGYNITLNQDQKVRISAGPYLAYGIAGKTRLSGDMVYGDMIDNTPVEEKTFRGRGLQKWDYGLGAGVGIDLGEVTLGIDYALGLRNIGPKNLTYFPFYNSSYKNRNLSVIFGFKL